MGIIETAKSGIKTFDGIMKMQKEIDLKLQGLGSRVNNAQLVLEHLYQHPLINAVRAKQYLFSDYIQLFL